MDYYTKYVPHVYVPESVVISDVLKSIDLYDAHHYLPQIWTDLKNFEYVTTIRLTEEFFGVLSKAKDKDLVNKSSEIGSIDYCLKT